MLVFIGFAPTAAFTTTTSTRPTALFSPRTSQSPRSSSTRIRGHNVDSNEEFAVLRQKYETLRVEKEQADREIRRLRGEVAELRQVCNELQDNHHRDSRAATTMAPGGSGGRRRWPPRARTAANTSMMNNVYKMYNDHNIYNNDFSNYDNNDNYIDEFRNQNQNYHAYHLTNKRGGLNYYQENANSPDNFSPPEMMR